MTQASKLKRVIRARAEKTGESYTTARRQVLARTPRVSALSRPTPLPVQSPPPPPIVREPRVPRVPRGELSDRTARKSTGHGLEHWFLVLDKFGTKNHTKAAEFLYSEHKVQAWHAQMITVTWERRRGLRQENQSCTGTFQVSVSRTLQAPVDWIAAVLNGRESRHRWLQDASPALRKALEEAYASGKSMEVKKTGYARMRYKWLSSVVELRVTEKAGGHCSMVADSSHLPDAGAVPVRREAFSRALDRLREIAAAQSRAPMRIEPAT
ncbi:MAG: hypothetical protein JJE39_04190 [Vicinamibacteria bacterium]|nr:hypothetical protein [Vicinamibacteria bacterium]